MGLDAQAESHKVLKNEGLWRNHSRRRFFSVQLSQPGREPALRPKRLCQTLEGSDLGGDCIGDMEIVAPERSCALGSCYTWLMGRTMAMIRSTTRRASM